MLQLCKLHLKLALMGSRTLGENIEYQACSVKHTTL